MIKQLKKGERSEMVKDFSRDLFLDNLHKNIQ